MKYCGLAVLIGFLAFSTSAVANVATYCAAYAKDFSLYFEGSPELQEHKQAIAMESCLSRFSKQEVKLASPQEPAKPKTKAEPVKKAAAKIVKKPETPVAEKAEAKKASEKTEVAAAEVKPKETTEKKPASKPTGGKPKLVEGSPEWLAYCEKKYASFDSKTKSYVSLTGKKRKCIVTAE